MPEKIDPIVIEQSLPHERWDNFLRGRFPEVSRGTIQRMMAEGHIRVNGQTVKPAHHPRAGDAVSVTWPEARPSEAQPEEMPLSILFEDADLLVINKPPGLVVHPAAGHEEHTLVNALLHHCAGNLSGIGGVARPGIVHRLDKDTSGCLVVAKNDATHMALSEQFSGREVSKTYHAIVCGSLPLISGEINAPIARHPTDRKRMAVVDTGREARTGYQLIERLRGATLVEARLHTGRTHQIRVHFQHLGYPVVGDAVYGKRQNQHLKSQTGCAPARQMLHAFKLSFIHPKSGAIVLCQAPLPEDFLATVTELNQ